MAGGADRNWATLRRSLLKLLPKRGDKVRLRRPDVKMAEQRRRIKSAGIIHDEALLRRGAPYICLKGKRTSPQQYVTAGNLHFSWSRLKRVPVCNWLCVPLSSLRTTLAMRESGHFNKRRVSIFEGPASVLKDFVRRIRSTLRTFSSLQDHEFDRRGEKNTSGTVIPPFLAGLFRRTQAAIFNFWAGVIPPMPMLGLSLL